MNFSEVLQNVARDGNLSLSDLGQLERAAKFDIQDMLKSLKEAADQGREKAERGKGGKGGGSFLRRIAEAMAQAMDSKVVEMEGLAKKMDGVKHKKGETDSTQIQTDLQVATQEFNMMMQSTANMIKTIGEGMAQMARKG